MLPRQSLFCSSGRKSRSVAGKRAELAFQEHLLMQAVCAGKAVCPAGTPPVVGELPGCLWATVLWSTLPVCCRLFITPCLSADDGAEQCSGVSWLAVDVF